uniref:Uncharacterized protein n=1 Tax=Setaria digitata TaxID=48799 RepID=A0A915PMY3_9BILA
MPVNVNGDDYDCSSGNDNNGNADGTVLIVNKRINQKFTNLKCDYVVSV